MTLHPSVHRLRLTNPVRNIMLCMMLAGIIGLANAQSRPGSSSTAPKPASEAEPSDTADDSWGAVPARKVSLVNAAPVLLPYFNNGPVFGMWGTNVGDFWH